MSKPEEIIGGVSDNVTVEQIADKFGISVAEAEAEIERGAKVEREHTDDVDKAREIAMDHIWETKPERGITYYYDSLEKIEESRMELRMYILENSGILGVR